MIDYLHDDILLLTELIAAGGTSESEYVNASRDLQVPIRLGVEALRRSIDFELQFWAYHVADKLGITWDPQQMAHMRQQVRAHRAMSLLTKSIDTLCALPHVPHPNWSHNGGISSYRLLSGIDGTCHLVELHERAYRVSGRTKLVHRLTPACPICDRKTLVRENGADFVRCEGCGKKIAEKHYDWFVQVTISEEKRLRGEGVA